MFVDDYHLIFFLINKIQFVICGFKHGTYFEGLLVLFWFWVFLVVCFQCHCFLLDLSAHEKHLGSAKCIIEKL